MTLYVRKVIVLIVILSICFSNFACMTMKPIPLTEPGNVRNEIKLGDTIQYQTTFGKTEKLKITSVGDGILKGTSNGQVREVMIADMQSIERKEVSAVTTTLVALGTILLPIAIIAATELSRGLAKGPLLR